MRRSAPSGRASLTKEQRATCVPCEYEAFAFDYVKLVEKTPDGKFAFVRKGRVREYRKVPVKSGKRGKVFSMSRKSWLRMTEHALRCPIKFTRFITLTYHNVWPNDSATSKKHLQDVLKRLKSGGVKNYFWCLEFQDRGAPHYHIWTDAEFAGGEVALVACWREITGDYSITGVSDEPLRKTVAHYISKEMSKRWQKVAPKDWPSGRMWAHSPFKLNPLIEVPIDGYSVEHPTIVFPHYGSEDKKEKASNRIKQSHAKTKISSNTRRSRFIRDVGKDHAAMDRERCGK